MAKVPLLKVMVALAPNWFATVVERIPPLIVTAFAMATPPPVLLKVRVPVGTVVSPLYVFELVPAKVSVPAPATVRAPPDPVMAPDAEIVVPFVSNVAVIPFAIEMGREEATAPPALRVPFAVLNVKGIVLKPKAASDAICSVPA